MRNPDDVLANFNLENEIPARRNVSNTIDNEY